MNVKRLRFIAEYAVDGNASAAARRAGYSPQSARVNGPRMLRNAAIQQALVQNQRETARKLELDREKILAGLMEAVDVARAQADAGGLIRAWTEIARLMGYYQPEIRRVVVTAKSGRIISQLETLQDEQLLAMAAAGPQ